MRLPAGVAVLSAAALVLAVPSAAVAAPSSRSTSTEHLRSGEQSRSGEQARGSLPTERSLLVRPPAGVGDLYALNGLTRHVVRFDLVQGRWRTSLVGTGWTDPTALAVSGTGVAWVVDAGTGKLVRVARNGTQRVVRTLADPGGTHLSTGHRGELYLNDGARILRVSRSGRTITTLGTVAATDGVLYGLGATAGRTVTVVHLGADRNDPDGFSNVDATRLGGDGTTTVRHLGASSIDGDDGISGVRVASDGAIALHEFAGLGSGYTGTSLFAPGATQAITPTTHLAATAYAFDAGDRFHLLQSRRFCLNPELGEGCVPDPAVDEDLVYPPSADGAPTAVPIRDLSVPDELAADVDGRLWASGGGALRTVPPGGGSAYPVLAGAFFALQVPAGR